MERQSHIHEVDVVVALLVGILDGMPNGDLIGMEHEVGLPTESGIPQKGVAAVIGTGRTADDMIVIFGDEQLTLIAVIQVLKELFVRNIPFWLQPIVLAQQLVESLEVGWGVNCLTSHPSGIGILEVMHHLFRDPFLRRMAVQGVVDAHPVDGEILVLPELLVAEHLLRQVADFDVKSFLVQLLGEGSNHLTEKIVPAVGTFGIDAIAQDPTLDEEKRWEKGGAVTHICQQLAQHVAMIVGTDHHIWLHPGGSRTDVEQLSTMEEIAFLQHRHFVWPCVDMYLYSFHATNIRKESEKIVAALYFFNSFLYFCTIKQKNVLCQNSKIWPRCAVAIESLQTRKSMPTT